MRAESWASVRPRMMLLGQGTIRDVSLFPQFVGEAVGYFRSSRV
jgi:hypothetical protein